MDNVKYCKALGEMVDGRRCFYCFYDEGWTWHLKCKKQNLVEPGRLRQRIKRRLRSIVGRAAL